MNFFENITFRKTRTQSTSEILSNDESSTNNSKIDVTTSSMPNLSCDENNIQIQELKEQIVQLTLQLNSAHEEVNNLSIENLELKTTIQKLTFTHEGLGKATDKLSVDIVTPRNSQKITTPRSNSTKKTQKWNKVHSTPISQRSLTAPATQLQEKTTQPREPTTKLKLARKICIISANKTNKILSIAENTFLNTELCHYILPSCGILQLISNINKKLEHFSKEDYCVILIGEEDFRKTTNYFDIIVEIRKTLQKIQHTNIILCLPTFNCNNYSPMYNSRIETFNNLLYLDLHSYNYATLLDSNFELSYDHSMFYKRSGKLNNYGMYNIMSNILLIMKDNLDADSFSEIDIKSCNEANSTPSNSKLFLF